jgi:excinuclease ABC subunit C
MIVLIKGEPEKDQYRRFKIRLEKKPNDVAMIQEILKRRFNHPDWDHPDLIVIDGGKGQVNAAKKVLSQYKLEKIPLLGLAKRKERIVLPGKQIKEIKFSKDSPAFQLLKRSRDEAHRFALSYHRRLRSKTFF